MRKFFRQVFNSGIARINLHKRHPGSLKLVHLLPAVFTLGVMGLLLLFVTGIVLSAIGLTNAMHTYSVWGGLLMALSLLPLVLYSLLIFVDSSLQNRSLKVGILSVPAAFVQLLGYGSGFLKAWWLRCVCGRNEELQAFRKTFYK